jgi:hypothetical protein
VDQPLAKLRDVDPNDVVEAGVVVFGTAKYSGTNLLLPDVLGGKVLGLLADILQQITQARGAFKLTTINHSLE